MAAQNPAGWLQNAGNTHTAAQLRTYVGALAGGGLFSSGAVTRMRGGVHPVLGGQLQVTQNGTPNMTVNVASGVAFIPGTESGAQAMYFVENDATVNLSITTAPGAGLNRIDLIVAKIQDSFYSGATDAWSLAVVTGVAASSPTAPTPPNNSITLAQIFVGSNVTSIVTGNITDTRFYCSALGGVNRALSTARPAFPGVGDLIYETDTTPNRWRGWNGTSWIGIRDDFGNQTQILGASAASVTFSSIPTTMRRLSLRILAKCDAAVNTQNMYIRINGDSTSNYNSQETSSVNTVASGTNLPGTNVGLIGSVVGTSAASNQWGSATVEFQGWASSTGRACWTFVTQALANGAANFVVQTGGGQYLVAGPYSSITIMPATGNFIAGSEFILEGR